MIKTINETDIIQMYADGSSTYEIATKYNTNPNMIRRRLVKLGVKLRNKSEAQKEAINSGRVDHPTKGRERTNEEKLAISSSAVRYWNDMSDADREKRKKQAEKNWNDMSPVQREDMRRKGVREIQKAARAGSKLERKVQEFVSAAGYRFDAHKKNLIPTENLEIDLYIPALRAIIEVDGLSHFEPIWGEKALKAQVGADTKKDGVLLSRGFYLIRIENRSSSMALSKLAELSKQLVDVLTQIKEGTINSHLTVIKYE